MKKSTNLVYTVAWCALAICVHTTFLSLAPSQNIAVNWSAFDMGFAGSTAANTTVQSVAGQAFAGASQQDINLVTSGFLGYPFPMHVKIKLFLEGPFNVSTMRKTLNTSGILASHFFGVPIPSDAVDSINIEIRNAASAAGSTIRRFKSAWLLTDGTIRDYLDTVKTSLQFDPPVGSYYVVAKHRNHLAVMTATGQSLGLDPPASPYDFTEWSSGQKAYGTATAMKDLGGGVYGMYAGNNDGNNVINVLEYNAVGSSIFQSGYKIADHDMNGIVNVLDYNPVGLNIFKTSQVP